jgi:hypothetical protein
LALDKFEVTRELSQERLRLPSCLCIFHALEPIRANNKLFKAGQLASWAHSVLRAGFALEVLLAEFIF